MPQEGRTSVAMLFLPLLSACAGASEISRDIHDFLEGTNLARSHTASDAAPALSSAAIGLTYGYSPEIFLSLDSTEATRLTWFGQDRVLIVTDGGRIVKTAGLPVNLGGSSPFFPDTDNGEERRFGADFPDLNIFGAPILCKRQDYGDVTIRVPHGTIPAGHIVEHCSSRPLKWTFDNEYWEDRKTQYVWRSCQYIHPSAPPVMLEVLRPEPGGPDVAASSLDSGNIPANSASPAEAGYGCIFR
jgi:hypothetical protein